MTNGITCVEEVKMFGEFYCVVVAIIGNEDD